MRRASSSTTIHSNLLPGQVFVDPDMINVSNDSQKPKAQKRAGIFPGTGRNPRTQKNQTSTGKSTSSSSALINSSTSSTSSMKTSTSTLDSEQAELSPSAVTNSNESPTTSTVGSLGPVTNARKNARVPHADTVSQVNNRSVATNGKHDRRKDIKLTNCQEKDGIWTATGQFGRESRQSKRADITYDKKKFRFIQKDDQGNKHVFEIPAAEIEGN